jgi:Zn finger protein HypA/HybF involved in hydrogenase expression
VGIKKKNKKKSPSRIKYEQKHPTISIRLDVESKKSLEEHLEGTGCSAADFVKDHLGREKGMVEKRVEIQASRQVGQSLEGRVRCLEDLVHQIFSILHMTIDTDEHPFYCPRCDNQELFKVEGREIESGLAEPWVFTWKCPKCGFFIDSGKRIDPKSIHWIDPDTFRRVDKPGVSDEHKLKKSKQHGDEDNG